jgi:HD-GYP domain-containing protein (c-di-GMP phosphodiesterase class II)/DNA-binding CsgD family transcriptional regulator
MSTEPSLHRARPSFVPSRPRPGRRLEHVPASASSTIRLAELLGRLSLAFDVANHAPYGRAVRSVVLAVELGRRAGATAEELHDTFWVSLLSNLGCTSLELAEVVGAGPRILSGLAQLCDRWDGHGVPNPLDIRALALPMRLSHLGHVAVIARAQHGWDGAVALVRRSTADHIDPRLARLFVQGRDELADAIEAPQIFDHFLSLEPVPGVCADENRVDAVARALAIFADLKCPLFLGHSTGVAALAERAAGELGLGADDTRTLRRAGLLHDIGRLGVPNEIWMRPGPLDWGEMERVRLHAYYTDRVLAPIGMLVSVAEIAAAAHERLDGSGYTQNRMGRALVLAARVLAVADMAFAMGEARPHRAPMSRDAIANEIAAEVAAGHLDGSAADAVLASLGVEIRVAPRNAHGLSERELEVCRLIARGKMNKEIAELLGISLRTVQNHIAHIFDKLGVHTRSGVAVWLVESDFGQ